MPTFTKLIGPTKTERTRGYIAWSFVGVVGADECSEVCRWKLYFYFDSRRFVARYRELAHGDENLAAPALFEYGRLEKPIKGKVTAVLRHRLKPEHIAEATSMAIRYKGTPSL